ncbi:hypothetical protein A2U01_0065585, partial [Trifolium medium]|nr:hypothetical protein [Trifolium medium]
ETTAVESQRQKRECAAAERDATAGERGRPPARVTAL